MLLVPGENGIMQLEIFSGTNLDYTKCYSHFTVSSRAAVALIDTDVTYIHLRVLQEYTSPFSLRMIKVYAEIHLGWKNNSPYFYDNDITFQHSLVGTGTVDQIFTSFDSDPYSLQFKKDETASEKYPSVTLQWSENYIFTYVIIVNYNGLTYQLDVEDSAPCTPIGTNDITLDTIHIFTCNSVLGNQITLKNPEANLQDISFNSVMILSDNCANRAWELTNPYETYTQTVDRRRLYNG